MQQLGVNKKGRVAIDELHGQLGETNNYILSLHLVEALGRT